MSGETTVADYGGVRRRTERQRERRHDGWQPGDADSAVAEHRQCQGCESLVTEQFRRVFGDNDDVVHACPTCATRAQLTDGAGADPEYDTDAIVAERRGVRAASDAHRGGP